MHRCGPQFLPLDHGPWAEQARLPSVNPSSHSARVRVNSGPGNTGTSRHRPAPRRPLAGGAEEARAVHEGDPPDRSAAARARPPRLAVDGQRAIEIAALAVHVHVQRIEGRPPGPQRLLEHPAHLRQQGRDGGAGQGRRAPGAVHPGPPQGFVGGDVADPRHERLVEQRPLELGVPAPQPGGEEQVVEVRVDRVTGDVRDLRRHELVGAVGGRDELVEEDSPERPLVDETQFAAAVGEPDADVQVLLVRGVGRADEQLTAHAEVGDEGLAPAALRSGQREPEVLAAPGRGLDREAGEAGGEVIPAADVPTDGAGVTDLHGGGRTAGDPALQAVAHGLDLRQLRHGSGQPWEAAGAWGRALIARQAVSAASCSASFLLLPVEAANSSPATWARAVKVFSWSGPVEDITYSGTPRPCSAVSSCRLVFQSSPAPTVTTSASRSSKRSWITRLATSSPTSR